MVLSKAASLSMSTTAMDIVSCRPEKDTGAKASADKIAIAARSRDWAIRFIMLLCALLGDIEWIDATLGVRCKLVLILPTMAMATQRRPSFSKDFGPCQLPTACCCRQKTQRVTFRCRPTDDGRCT